MKQLRFKDLQIGDVFVDRRGHNLVKIGNVPSDMTNIWLLPECYPTAIDMNTGNYIVCPANMIIKKIVKRRKDPKNIEPAENYQIRQYNKLSDDKKDKLRRNIGIMNADDYADYRLRQGKFER